MSDAEEAIEMARETFLCYECGQSMLHWQYVYHAYDNHNANNARQDDTP